MIQMRIRDWIWTDRGIDQPLVLRGARQVGKSWILQNLSMDTGKAITTDM